MTFYTYMMRNYLTETSARGDLARDMKQDGMNFPKTALANLTDGMD